MGMPLTMATSGEINIVKRIQGRDRNQTFSGRGCGFVEGEQVQVISEISGNLIVNVKDTRIALSKSMANRIMI